MVTMSREECLVKLLALEPETRERVALVTGWPHGESDRVLSELQQRGLVTYGAGPFPTGGVRRYYPTKAALSRYSVTNPRRSHAL